MNRYLSSILIVLTLLSTCAVGAGYYLMALHSETESRVPTSSPIKGYIYFLSSKQVKKNSNQGSDDEVQIDLTTIPNPAVQKSYYAWLMSGKSQSDPLSFLLGVLSVKEGTAHLFYPGSMQHTNLLEIMGRFLVTEEDATLTPVSPSLDTTTWHYYAEFTRTLSTASNAPNNTNKGGMSVTHEGSTQRIQFRFPIYSLDKGA